MVSLRPLALRIGAVGWMPRLLPMITRVDLALQRTTHGRIGLLDVAGLPNLLLEAPGRRSGVPRRTPLLCAEDGPRVIIAGSNFGLAAHPAWVHNLGVLTTARIRRHGRWSTVFVEELQGSDRVAARAIMLETWPNFAVYEQRTSRRIRMFRLTPTDPARP